MLSCRWRFCREVGPRRDSVGTLFSLFPSSLNSWKKNNYNKDLLKLVSDYDYDEMTLALHCDGIGVFGKSELPDWCVGFVSWILMNDKPRVEEWQADWEKVGWENNDIVPGPSQPSPGCWSPLRTTEFAHFTNLQYQCGLAGEVKSYISQDPGKIILNTAFRSLLHW